MRQTLRLCVLFALVSAALALQAWHSAQLSLKHQLLSQIPEAVNASLVNAYDTQLQLAHNSQQLVSHINASAFNVRLPLDFIQQITLRDLTLFVHHRRKAVRAAPASGGCIVALWRATAGRQLHNRRTICVV